MSKRFLLISLFFNLIFLVVLGLATYSTIFDLWFWNKSLPKVCAEKQGDETVLSFCREQNIGTEATE